MHGWRRQRGGTFLGLVLGIVIGLGIALGVAVYVTKVPVPFVNKGNTRNTEQDAEEARRNKDWNPNALIQGKSARPANTASSGKADAPVAEARSEEKAVAPNDNKASARGESKTGAGAEPKAEAKADAKSDAPAEAKPKAGDPLGDLAKARAQAPVEPFTYMVQTGAFRVPDDAEAQRAKLALTGIEAKVSEREQAGRTVFRVRTGPFERREDAERMKEKLEAAGYDAVMVRLQR